MELDRLPLLCLFAQLQLRLHEIERVACAVLCVSASIEEHHTRACRVARSETVQKVLRISLIVLGYCHFSRVDFQVFVPLFGALLGNGITLVTVASSLLALLGTGFLELGDSSTSLSDLWCVAQAVAFAIGFVRIEVCMCVCVCSALPWRRWWLVVTSSVCYCIHLGFE